MRLLWVPAFAIASLAACSFDADFEGTRFQCADGDGCPSGLTCRGGECRPPGDEVDAAPDSELDASVVGASCASLHEEGEDASGVYLVDPDGPGGAAPFEVYCDMVMDGGGWTLVARSVEGGEGMFGWLDAAGDVRALEAPYSLGTDRPGFAFSRLLVGSQSGGYGWGGRVYRVAGVPQGFPVEYQDDAVGTERSTVAGNCAPLFGPSMLNVIGYTDSPDHFFFRDQAIESAYGLHPDGWSLYYNDCENAGWLDDVQGMIFVR